MHLIPLFAFFPFLSLIPVLFSTWPAHSSFYNNAISLRVACNYFFESFANAVAHVLHIFNTIFFFWTAENFSNSVNLHLSCTARVRRTVIFIVPFVQRIEFINFIVYQGFVVIASLAKTWFNCCVDRFCTVISNRGGYAKWGKKLLPRAVSWNCKIFLEIFLHCKCLRVHKICLTLHHQYRINGV